MEAIHQLLVNIWFAILGLFLILYVVLDGFTLGVGILSLVSRDKHQRGIMMASLGGVWDANETWLLVFGGALFGSFPLVYSVLLHGLYIPLAALIFALIFRGIAFEFHERAQQKQGWFLAFGIGSLIAVLVQGYAVGSILRGVPVEGRSFSGTAFHWISMFSTLTAVGVFFGFVLLGATYLIYKTTNELQQRSYRFAWLSAWLTSAAGLGVSIWTPLRFEYIAERWFTWPNTVYLAPLPLTAIFAFFMLLRALRKHYELAPFVWSVIIFVASFMGFAVSIYPYFIPPTITIFESSASAYTLAFMLAGIAALIPLMLIYNIYQYVVFRGKVKTPHYDH